MIFEFLQRVLPGELFRNDLYGSRSYHWDVGNFTLVTSKRVGPLYCLADCAASWKPEFKGFFSHVGHRNFDIWWSKGGPL